MTATPAASIQTHFAHVDDPRIDRNKAHSLLDMFVIAICAIICGANDWVAVEEFGNAKRSWLRRFLDLPNGIPSHDTFGRVFARLDPDQLEQGFTNWFAALHEATDGEVVAVDGKQLRQSADRAWGRAAIEMVSAWASANRLVLGQEKVATGSNEITAVPALLERLALGGCIVTLDALHCQTDTAATIVAQDADYVLTVKQNQPTLYAGIEQAFAQAHATNFWGYAADTFQTTEEDHGRWERRTYWTLADAGLLRAIDPTGRWPALRAIGMVRSERQETGKPMTVETRYYIMSVDGNAQTFGHAVRSHWGVENEVHWRLDVVFREDASHLRVGKGPENMALLRRLALNLLHREQSKKRSMQTKRLRAGWDEDYLLKLLVE
jgi:predicted transposase YbfD/YdcC